MSRLLPTSFRECRFTRRPPDYSKRANLLFSKNGFTLMEILIAVGVLAVGVVGVVNMFPVGLQAARRTADFTKLSHIAQREVSFYSFEGYEYIDDFFNNPSGDYQWVPVGGVDYLYYPSVDTDDPDADPFLRAGGIANALEFVGDEGFFYRLVISDDVDEGDVQVGADIYEIALTQFRHVPP